ncbi:hypothetical protein BV22DRAFT_1115413 [Leucogyrophana mollusca]|uniref:Uncharacterized protein n=1 Tax=Leucogyrophana mollusca TaxID=85980 RepID=A0ACB8AZ45_9AGAM|nr:hypothetical protein BV22DRAFT_1115413 [Leucogyrophana mollusca]
MNRSLWPAAFLYFIMQSSRVPSPVAILTPELSSRLKESIEGVLVHLIKTDLPTRFVRDSPVFHKFRSVVEQLGNTDSKARDEALLESFYNTISLTGYESGTSGKSAKLFARYRRPLSYACPPKPGGRFCSVYSLTYREVIEVPRNDGAPAQIPITLGSSGTIRMFNDMDVEKDSWMIKLTMPNATSPIAVSYIRNYRSFLLMHALFALADITLERLDTIFGTVFLDLVRYMEEDWDTLVSSIETGDLPEYEGISHVREHLEPKLRPNTPRAAELRTIGNATAQPGWLHRIWPQLKEVVGIVSGLFAAAIPKMRHYLGPNILVRSAGFGASEGVIGWVYDPTEPNLFKATCGDIIEYLDVLRGETAASLVPAWKLETGRKYEVVMTTYDGLWRYRIGDVVEIAGFDPCDGVPVLKYVERRNAGALGGVMTTEKQLTEAILATEKTLGRFVEFTVVVDERVMPRRFGYLVEVLGAVALGQLRDELCRSNANIKRCLDQGSIGEPTIRILKPGTFSEFRKWKIDLAKTGAGQMKVPVVLSDEAAQQWLFERVMCDVS